MSTAKILLIVAAVLEGILAIPLLGGSIVMGLLYIPLVVMLVLHIVTLVFAAQEGAPKYASIFGIVTSALAWIPFLGWFMHVIAFILLTIAAVTTKGSKHYI